MKTELTTEWGYPILQVVEQDLSVTYYYPLVAGDYLFSAQAPKLVKGKPCWLMSKSHQVALFVADDYPMLPYLLSVRDAA